MTAPSASATGDPIELLKDRARATWAAGDYDAVADGIWEVGEVVVERMAVSDGDAVLDVACGTGNAAVRAAVAGGRVTGLDLTPSMFEAARRRAAEAGVEVTWIEGDAEALPFADASFDIVLSTFGAMFAPRHEVAAREMARVLRAGGRVGMATWTPEGSVGGLFATVARHLPPPPAIAASPMLWGVEDHVRSVFAGTGIELEFARQRLQVNVDVDLDEATAFYIASFGPLVTARALLEPQGGWAPLEAELDPAIRRLFSDPPEYLLITGTKAA